MAAAGLLLSLVAAQAQPADAESGKAMFHARHSAANGASG
jgi:hypothetical protein